MNIIKGILNLIRDWSNVLLILVGLSAFVVYFLQKRDEKRAAATLLKSQIDSIEKIIEQLKNDHQLGDESIYNSGTILNENLWERYKHLFVKQLSQSEIDIIQRFFNYSEQIERTRADISRMMMAGWKQHGDVQHIIVGEFIKNEMSNPEMKLSDIKIDYVDWQKFYKKFSKYDFAFTPQIIIDSLMKALENFSNLSGTTAYEKIQKSSFEK